MGFKLKSGNKVDFKMMGSDSVRNMKDGDYSQSFEKPGPPQFEKFTHSWDGVDESKNTLERGSTGLTENKEFGGDATSLIQAKNEEKEELKDATDGKGVKKDADGNPITNDDDNTTGGSAGAELKTTSDKYNPDGTLKEGDKKWHEKDAFRNTGVGHITDAVKSISRGIKNIRAKNKAKKAEELASANEAIKDGTQTLKQQKLVDKTSKRKTRKETNASEKRTKDQEKLAKYKEKKTKKAIKGFKKNTVVKNGKTYSKNATATTSTNTPTDAELMALHEANRKKQGKSTF